MRIKRVKAAVHSIPVVVPLIKQPIEQRKFVFCQVEFHLGMKYVEDQIFKSPPEPDPKDNVVRIPKAPGLGLEPNMDVLRDTLVRQ